MTKDYVIDYSDAIKMEKRRVTTITRTGVVQFYGYDRALMVNSDEVLREIEKNIDDMKPKKDNDGKFAACISITVQLLGDLVEESAEESHAEGDAPD